MIDILACKDFVSLFKDPNNSKEELFFYLQGVYSRSEFDILNCWKIKDDGELDTFASYRHLCILEFLIKKNNTTLILELIKSNPSETLPILSMSLMSMPAKTPGQQQLSEKYFDALVEEIERLFYRIEVDKFHCQIFRLAIKEVKLKLNKYSF